MIKRVHTIKNTLLYRASRWNWWTVNDRLITQVETGIWTQAPILQVQMPIWHTALIYRQSHGYC